MAIISDVHCRGESCPGQREFVAWLADLEADALWLLGDIFHTGWEFGHREQPEYCEVYRALEAVVESGVELLFVPGNHDFALAGFFQERLGATVSGPHVREVDGTRVFLAHGDESDMRVGYRAVRSVLRSRVFGLFMRCLGVRLGTSLLRKLAGDFPEKGTVWGSTKNWLKNQTRNADLAIVGHVHVEWSDGGMATLGPGVKGARRLVDGVLVD